MKLEDWHTHSALCHHAVGTLEDYVKAAIKNGLDMIGFSDHFPYEFYTGIENVPYKEYAMTMEEIQFYLFRSNELREKYSDKIEIKIGFEVEFIEN